MKIWFTFLLALSFLASTAMANVLPPIPDDCFSETNYCHSGDVRTDQNGRKMINVRLFARIDSNAYSNTEEVIARFYDFASWPSYVSESDDISFRLSRELEPTFINGRAIRRHEAHYRVKAPFPFRKIDVVETAHNFTLRPYEGALASFGFELDKSSPLDGLKHKSGTVHIALDSATSEYILYLDMDVIPEIELLPSVAAPYIERAMIAVFLGMYNITITH